MQKSIERQTASRKLSSKLNEVLNLVACCASYLTVAYIFSDYLKRQVLKYTKNIRDEIYDRILFSAKMDSMGFHYSYLYYRSFINYEERKIVLE